MTRDDLQDRLRRRPFQPFRICVADGATFDISHPDQAMPLILSVEVAVKPSLGVPEDNPVTVSILHITRLEPIAPPATTN